VWGFLLSSAVLRWVVGQVLLVRRPRFVLGSLYRNDGLLVVGALVLLVLFYLGGVRATCLGTSKPVCFWPGLDRLFHRRSDMVSLSCSASCIPRIGSLGNSLMLLVVPRLTGGSSPLRCFLY
jgi:hypothetical protein